MNRLRARYIANRRLLAKIERQGAELKSVKETLPDEWYKKQPKEVRKAIYCAITMAYNLGCRAMTDVDDLIFEEQNTKQGGITTMSDNDSIRRDEMFFPALDGYVLRSRVISGLYRAGFRKAADYCKALPVVPTVMQPKGRWLTSDIPNEKYVCSNCGGACWYYDVGGEVAQSNFCPNCGADMREDSNE